MRFEAVTEALATWLSESVARLVTPSSCQGFAPPVVPCDVLSWVVRLMSVATSMSSIEGMTVPAGMGRTACTTGRMPTMHTGHGNVIGTRWVPF